MISFEEWAEENNIQPGSGRYLDCKAAWDCGMDKARWQIVRLCLGFSLGVMIYQVAKHAF